MFKQLTACVLGLALTASLAGCQSPSGNGAAGGGNSGTIKIGFVAPLTGAASSYGQSSQKGLQLLEDQTNKAGGINGRKVQFLSVDDEGKAATAVTGGQKLINNDQVAAIVGPVTSTSANSLAPICQQYSIPMITGTGTNADITSAGDFVFQTCFIDPFQGKVMAKFATEDLKTKTAAILYNNGDDYSKGLADAFKSSFTEKGGSIVDTETYNTGDKDFNAQLTKIAPKNPDVLFLPDYYSTVAVIMKEARSTGVKSIFLGGDGFDSPQLFSIGGDAVNGAYFSTHYSSEDTSKEVVQFIKDYKAKFSSEPDAFAALTYDAGKVLLESIRKAGSTDANAVKNALKSYDGTVVCGHIKFDSKRDAVKSAVIIKAENGKEKFFKKASA
ncbi:MAG: ABC transporter substrate-binding protein [Oscillospiraceae bacterium]|jgi:branched-chain amino acid transport system substrate-binding protein|nr:ABC transporter substrate-binding protein [Oscillospiraceae bacterium]MCI2034711.1 ABC transporter substrate-binding protein [Oscillospiraceae bacterium]